VSLCVGGWVCGRTERERERERECEKSGNRERMVFYLLLYGKAERL